MAEEKKGPAKRGDNPSIKYSGLPPGEHGGVGGVHGTIKVSEAGTYETSDPVEQAFIQDVLGGTPKE